MRFFVYSQQASLTALTIVHPETDIYIGTCANGHNQPTHMRNTPKDRCDSRIHAVPLSPCDGGTDLDRLSLRSSLLSRRDELLRRELDRSTCLSLSLSLPLSFCRPLWKESASPLGLLPLSSSCPFVSLPPPPPSSLLVQSPNGGNVALMSCTPSMLKAPPPPDPPSLDGLLKSPPRLPKPKLPDAPACSGGGARAARISESNASIPRRI